MYSRLGGVPVGKNKVPRVKPLQGVKVVSPYGQEGCCVFRPANWYSARCLLVEINFDAKATFCVLLSHKMYKIAQKLTKIQV